MDQGLALGIGATLILVLLITGPWLVPGICKIRLYLARRQLRKSEERLARLRELQENQAD